MIHFLSDSLSANIDCDFCQELFPNRSEYNEHIVKHFVRKCCNDCNKPLIQIGDNFYELHVSTNCISIKNEPAESVHSEQIEVDGISTDQMETEQIVVKPDVNVKTEEVESPIEEEQINGEDVPSEDDFEWPENVDDDGMDSDEDSIANIEMHIKPPEVKKEAHDDSDSDDEPTIFVCAYCHSDFARRNLVKIHVNRTHTSLEGFTCRFCQKKSKTRDDLLSHVTENHEYEPDYHKYKLLSMDDFVAPKQECHYCDRKFSKKLLLANHIQTQHLKSKKTPFSCQVCSKKFKSVNVVYSHWHTHSDNPIKCNVEKCGARYKKIMPFTKHLKFVHQIKGVSSVDMEKQKLFTIVSEKPTTAFKCNLCDREFSRSSALQLHNRNSHPAEKPTTFKCTRTSCGKLFLSESTLSEHLLEHRFKDNDPTVERFQCETCDAEFCTMARLRIHITMTHDGRKYLCVKCGRDFKSSKGLNQHAKSCH